MLHSVAIKSLWRGSCDVYVREPAVNADNGTTVLKEVLRIKEQPCRLSFKASGIREKDGASTTEQSIKLFVDRDLDIPEGSKIVVTQNGRTTAYCQSDTPMVYSTHQEICLKLFKEWA